MKDKVCLVTGASAGIGTVTALELARAGAEVVMVGRDPARSEAALREVQEKSGSRSVSLILADLSSRKGVEKVAEEFKAKHDRLHVLVNNAGINAMKRVVTADGLESTFAVNHLAYYHLTLLLLDLLKKSAPSRIVNVSSSAHKGVRLDFDDLQSARRYSAFKVYAQSKLANLLFTYALARRLQGTGVTVNALHPGVIPSTSLSRELPKFVVSLVDVTSKLFRFGSTLEEGAKTTLYLAMSPEVEGVSGKYFVKCKEARSSAASYDEAAQERLWKASAELTGVG